MAERFRHSVVVNASPIDCFNVWRKFQEFPSFMKHVREVRHKGGDLYHWVVEGPMGRNVEWDAHIDGCEEGRLISWHSTGDVDVGVQGAVLFDDLGSGQTRVTCTMQYEPPAGVIGAAIANIFANPQKMVEDDLENFKRLIEGQAAGERGVPASAPQSPLKEEGTRHQYVFGGQAEQTEASASDVSGQSGLDATRERHNTLADSYPEIGSDEAECCEPDSIEDAREEYNERETLTRSSIDRQNRLE